jgi:hypothetical protein
MYQPFLTGPGPKGSDLSRTPGTPETPETPGTPTSLYGVFIPTPLNFPSPQGEPPESRMGVMGPGGPPIFKIYKDTEEDREEQARRAGGSKIQSPYIPVFGEDEKDRMMKRLPGPSGVPSWNSILQPELKEANTILNVKEGEEYYKEWENYIKAAIKQSEMKPFVGDRYRDLISIVTKVKKELSRLSKNYVFLKRVLDGDPVYDLGSFTVIGTAKFRENMKFKWANNEYFTVTTDAGDVIEKPPEGSFYEEEIRRALEFYITAIDWFRGNVHPETSETVHEAQINYNLFIGVEEANLLNPVDIVIDGDEGETALDSLHNLHRMIVGGNSKERVRNFYDYKIAGKITSRRETRKMLENFLTKGVKPELPEAVVKGEEDYHVVFFPENPLAMYEKYHKVLMDLARYKAVERMVKENSLFNRFLF